MNKVISEIASNITLKKVGRGWAVTYQGNRCAYIGGGVGRLVYSLGEEYVLKVVRDFSTECKEQQETEYKVYNSLPKKVKSMVAKVYHKFDVGGVTCLIQKRVKGNTLARSVSSKEEYARFNNLRNVLYKKYRIVDIHEDNVIVDAQGQWKIVDLGFSSSSSEYNGTTQ